jgi:hypothetical protein
MTGRQKDIQRLKKRLAELEAEEETTLTVPCAWCPDSDGVTIEEDDEEKTLRVGVYHEGGARFIRLSRDGAKEIQKFLSDWI